MTTPDRLISADTREEDLEIEQTLRPQRLPDYIGQPKVKENLKIFIQAAKERGEALDHALFYGPPGLGKTTLAHIIAREMNVNIKSTSGPVIEHAGELSGFFILATFILKSYFNNFPNLANIWARATVRTAIAMAGGLLFYWFYYSPLATFFLAKVPGFAQPGDTPLVWILLFLSIIMIQRDFFGGWPLVKEEA